MSNTSGGRGGGGGGGDRGGRGGGGGWSGRGGGGGGGGGGRPWRGRGRWWRGRGSSYRGRSETPPAAGRPVGSSRHPQQRTVHSTTYPAWDKYLPGHSGSEQTALANRVSAFVVYFKSHLHDYNLDEVETRCSLPLDFEAVTTDEVLMGSIPSLRDLIQNQPETVLNCLGLALHTVLSALYSELEGGEGGAGEGGRGAGGGGGERGGGERASEVSAIITYPPLELPRLSIRLYNYDPVTLLKNVKASLYGKLVCIQGTVVRAGNIRPLVTHIAFQCLLCHEVQVLALPDGKYTVPVTCLEPECRGRQFTPLRGSPHTQTIDWQTIRVQELAMDGQREAGRIPRTIEVELTSDLVDSCVPGDMVTITAVVKATGSNEGRGRQNKEKCLFLLYLDAVSVTNNKGPDITHSLHMQFSTRDYYGIREIHQDSNIFRLLVNSLCPTIYGHEMVKAGLVLGLFGASQKYADSDNNIPIRGDPHVLVVGDPGLGKSQMLQAAANLAPRGVYVCGNTTSTAGLTVTLAKEAGSGDFALEAGALVLADQGCCCIDEFDKMGSQHHALLEAMEQQSVSLAKAGVVCSLPARASILAAANPTGGHYNKAKTVSENLKMSSALLSRFDLVFILLDKPDEETDSILSEHVMALHSGATSSQRHQRIRVSGRETPESVLQLGDDDRTLRDDLKLPRGTEFDPLPAPLFRKYIGYARKYVHPRLSHDAAKVLQMFYKELRQARYGSDSTPVTTRQLESLIRLTEARARLELREEATEQDAKDVVEIMKFSMYDTFTDEFGMVDFNRSQHGSGMSQRSQAKRLVCALTRMADRTANSIFTVQQIKDVAKEIGIGIERVSDLIFTLNNESYLLKKGPKKYQLQTAD